MKPGGVEEWDHGSGIWLWRGLGDPSRGALAFWASLPIQTISQALPVLTFRVTLGWGPALSDLRGS